MNGVVCASRFRFVIPARIAADLMCFVANATELIKDFQKEGDKTPSAGSTRQKKKH